MRGSSLNHGVDNQKSFLHSAKLIELESKIERFPIIQIQEM